MKAFDSARRKTDKELARIEKEISKQFRQANKEITAEWYSYMNKASKRLDKREMALSKAFRSGDKEKIQEARNALETAKKDITFRNIRYKTLVEETARNIAEANKTAMEYTQGRLPNVYSWNFNMAKESADTVKLSWVNVNADVVKKRIVDGDIKLPASKKRLSIPKDVRWNTKKMNSAVLQGILQGEDMKKIAKRIEPIVDGNKAAAIRNARTLVGQAENLGRLDSYKRLDDMGIVQTKRWISTGDGRTRNWHLSMDGQEVELKEMFIDGLGNELECPHDPSAPPETVYNCRCAMVNEVIGFRTPDGDIISVEAAKDYNTRHAEEIEAERRRRE